VRRHRIAALATVSVSGEPEVAIVRFVVTENFELAFDTTEATRKAANLRRNPKVAIAIGWDEGQTIQIEGLADAPGGEDLERLKRCYSQSYPDFFRAHQAAKGLIYFRVRPAWMCYSDFRRNPASIVKLNLLTGEESRMLEPFLGDKPTEHPETLSNP